MELVMQNIFIIVISLIFGFVAGHGAIYAFNKFPAKWFCDYGEEPPEELNIQGKIRMKSHPWKMALSMIFAVIAIKLGMENWQLAIPSVIAIWVIVEIMMADRLYMIIPDQLVMLLALTGFGFVPFYEDLYTPLLGALLGFAPLLSLFLMGKMVFKKEVVGFGDVKLMGALGFLIGPSGIIFVFTAGFLMSGIFYGMGLLLGKIKLKDEGPLGPFLGGGAILYLVFYKDLQFFLNIV